ncbi:MAG: hypothetical protein HZB33_15680 [Nitrospirae bacterium]|nr:hypothetical protein [Nitrospirota bacterium]
MGKEEEIKARVFQGALNYVRETHPAAIDTAYNYFWDDQQPDEFMGGVALELGFINFEDWLIFDYKANEEKESFLSIYVNRNPCPGDGDAEVVDKIKGSVLSLYEVDSVLLDKKVQLRDLLRGGEFPLRDKPLTRGLKKGDIFATRLLKLDGHYVMSGCVYPYASEQKDQVLRYVDKQFIRFKRNVDPEGTMEGYLKDYGDVFNLIWMKYIMDPASNAA